jgi:hypothetical protein
MSKKQREPEVIGGEINWPGFARLAVVPYGYILILRFGNARNIIYYFEKSFPPPPARGRGMEISHRKIWGYKFCRIGAHG